MLGVHGLRSDQDLVRLVEERLATGAIERLLQSGLTGDEIFSLIVPRRTLTHRRARHEGLEPGGIGSSCTPRSYCRARGTGLRRPRTRLALAPCDQAPIQGSQPPATHRHRSRRAPRRGAVVPHRRGHGGLERCSSGRSATISPWRVTERLRTPDASTLAAVAWSIALRVQPPRCSRSGPLRDGHRGAAVPLPPVQDRGA
jgi:hypothetical protein